MKVLPSHLDSQRLTTKKTTIFSIVFISGFLIVCSIILALTHTPLPLFSQSTTFSTPLSTSPSPRTPIVYGYLPYWTRSSAIIPQEVTHVSYFSLGIQPDGHILDLPKSAQEPGYRAFQAGVLQNLRKEISPNQKLELTLTMMDQTAIPLFIASGSAQNTFLNDLREVVATSPISGLNIDIEYNGIVDETLQKDYADLLHKTKTLLTENSPPLTLSIATYADAGTIQRLSNLRLIEPYVDHIIMMAYDYHRRVSPQAGPNSPLFGKIERKWESDIMSDLRGYLSQVPPEKVLLGVPFYGYQWQVEDGDNPNSFTTPTTGSTITYENIPKIKKLPGAKEYFDPLAYSPYILFEKNGKQYVLYYDNPQSLSYKLELVHQAGLGGIAIWALGYEGSSSDLWDSIHSSLSL